MASPESRPLNASNEIGAGGDTALRQQAAPQTSRTAAQELMERETRLQFGEVPHALFGDPLGETSWQMYGGDQFLLRSTGEHYFYYRMGQGVTIERGHGADLTEESLWFNGSVYAAVASLNGLLPIHASAVAVDERVFAFTAPAGGGKSTLVAALAAKGLPMFCDDTLVLDLSNPDQIVCLPGHKRLKLTPEAVALTAAVAQEKVSTTVDKFYALPAAGDIQIAMPLAELVFLEEGPHSTISPIAGAECFVRMQDDHQTAHLFAGARQFDRTEQFEHLARLARQVRMARFTRPRDVTQFAAGVMLVLQYVASAGRQ